MSDPILEALARIEAKQDDLLANQARMDEELQQIKKDCKKSAAVLVQYQSTMTMLQDTSVEELMPSERAKLLASLSDAFTKTVAANAKVMPETSKLATAIEVLELFGEVVKERYPQHLQAFVELVEPLGVEIEKKYR